MPYFEEHYRDISYPLADKELRGLYNAQIGAIHAIGSHFTVSNEPALITMPTGSGKTAVLMMSPYLLKAKRVLVITPSRMVRNQIFEDFSSLKTLKEITVLDNKAGNPKVCELKSKIDSEEKWEKLRDYDVVIGTPNCLSPSLVNVPNPPKGLFDLMLIDEAHHSPAKTWNELMNSFSNTKQILFTATPFRRDKKEIKGRFVYNYPLSMAYKDKIFGKIRFIPAEDKKDPLNNDISIAKKAEEIFNHDKSKGWRHNIMVRTDAKKRADQLFDIYQKNTNLRLKVVHSDQSYTSMLNALDMMKSGDLDGVICVNMLGEGFNFPNLKIAAVHSPHRSLEITLQFIGRFARTNASNIKGAKFIAVPSEMEIEGEKLFQEDAIWQEAVIGLSNLKIQDETETRETLQKFDKPVASNIELENLSLYSLSPRRHVKIYRVSENFDIENDIPFEEPYEVFYRNIDNERTALVLITVETTKPRWSKLDRFLDAKYDLFVIYYCKKRSLLFINSSRSIDGLYDLISHSLDPNAKGLPTSYVHRVLKGLTGANFINIGMRNMRQTNNTESYKIISGSSTQGAVKQSDGLLYRQGHAFCTAKEGDKRVNIGFSSASKVWSSTMSKIPSLIRWCEDIGTKIDSAGSVKTNSGLDYLDAGRVVKKIPDNIVSADWDKDAYDFDNPTMISYKTKDGESLVRHILEIDLKIDYEKSNEDKVFLSLIGDKFFIPLEFTLDDFFKSSAQIEDIYIAKGESREGLIDYLNDNKIIFYTADFAQFVGNELFVPNIDNLSFNKDQVEGLGWEDIDIDNECDRKNGRSVHDYLENRLKKDRDNTIIFYDHGSGELADFFVIQEGQNYIKAQFFHCKGSKKPIPGNRVEDLYEVCGQAQKTLVWNNVTKLIKKIRQRSKANKYLRGTEEQLLEILRNNKNKKFISEIIIVQPGITKSKMSDKISQNLAATNDFIINAGWERVIVFASA